MTALVECHNLKVCKQGVTICSIPELVVDRGERLGLIGGNGSGKTTALRVLAGLEPDYQGHCRSIVTYKHTVYVHQAPYLFRGTVLSNVLYGLVACGISRRAGQAKAEEWLERLAIPHLIHRSTRSLSGGEGRRVALARAFALEPDLLLLDEPFADLDDQSMSFVIRGLSLLAPASTILIASPVALPAGAVDRTLEICKRVAY